MKHHVSKYVAVFAFCLVTPFLLTAQQPKPGLLDAQGLKRVVPPAYLFRGQ
jgi:hypothetical protein